MPGYDDQRAAQGSTIPAEVLAQIPERRGAIMGGGPQVMSQAEGVLLIPLPDDMARLMKLTQWQAAEIARLRERVFELETDPKSGDVIPLAEPRCGDLRRAAERCITAWTVVRGGVWDPNGLMDEHMAALRMALGPNV